MAWFRVGLVRGLRGWVAIAISTCGVAALLAACTIPVRFATPEEVRQATAPSPAPVSTGGSTTIVGGGLDQVQADLRRLIAQAGPSVVRVETASATGSGLLLDAAGTVVTPASLVAGAQPVTITTAAGQRYAGTVSGSDPASDVAVIRVSGATGLAAATFADSGTVQVGDVVVAVGNQLPPSGTASQGIVSGTTGTMSAGAVTLTGLITTTAPMAAGTSGSALLNTTGQVVGMTTLGPDGSPALGVAIPSNQVKTVAQKLLAGGSGTQAGNAYLGVSVTDASGGGALIQSVAAGGPAARAGIQPGWVIVAIGGQTVPNAAAVGQIVAGRAPGQQVTVAVRLPNGSSRSIPVVLGTA